MIVWDLEYSFSEPDFWITRVQISPNVDISRHSNGHISVVCDATVTWLGTLVVLHVLCMLIDPIQGQGQAHVAFELPTINNILRHFRVKLKTEGWQWQYGT